MISKEIEQLENNIQYSKKIVEMGIALERLHNSRDFKKVILEGYFEQEAIRLVHLKADPSMQGADQQKAVLVQMDAIGALKQYFQVLSMQASMADKAIQLDTETRDDLLSEGN